MKEKDATPKCNLPNLFFFVCLPHRVVSFRIAYQSNVQQISFFICMFPIFVLVIRDFIGIMYIEKILYRRLLTGCYKSVVKQINMKEHKIFYLLCIH